MPQDSEQFTAKYEKAGRIGQALIDNFYRAIADLYQKIPTPTNVLEVGAGDGYATRHIRRIVSDDAWICSSELRLAGVHSIRTLNPGVAALCQSVYRLAHRDQAADLVFCLEVLEHLDAPEAALLELVRACSGHLILSVPREPVWCALNLARLKYWSALGNTPGHVQHWSAASFIAFLSRHCEVVAVRRPLPWTIVLAKPKQLRGVAR